MSNTAGENGRTMKNGRTENGRRNPDEGQKKLVLQVALKSDTKRRGRKRPRVELKPELEEIAALWPAAKRFEMARKFRRWARQLRVSGFILFHDSHRCPRRPALCPFLGFGKRPECGRRRSISSSNSSSSSSAILLLVRVPSAIS